MIDYETIRSFVNVFIQEAKVKYKNNRMNKDTK